MDQIFVRSPYTKVILCCKLHKVLSWFRQIYFYCPASNSLKYGSRILTVFTFSGTGLKDINSLINVQLETKLSMYLLAYSASTGSRSQEHSVDVSISSNISFFFVGPSLTASDGSFLPTCSNPLSGVSSLFSMEFDHSAFSAFLFKKTEASPISASSPELTCFTASIL